MAEQIKKMTINGKSYLVGVGVMDETPHAVKHGEVFNDIDKNQAVGSFSHAEGSNTIASSSNSHVEGGGTTTLVRGYVRWQSSDLQWIQIDSSIDKRKYNLYDIIQIEGIWYTIISIDLSSGRFCLNVKMPKRLKTNELISVHIATHCAAGVTSHAEGSNTKAIGNISHSEGNSTIAFANASHGEGNHTLAFGAISHAEGDVTTAIGNTSHSEGKGALNENQETISNIVNNTFKSSIKHEINEILLINGVFYRVVSNERNDVVALDKSLVNSTNNSTINIAEIKGVSYGDYSHSEGGFTAAIGDCSHAAGTSTIAANKSQVALGEFNTFDKISSPKDFDKTKILYNIGNGTSNENRSDALKMLGDGTTWICGVGGFNGKNANTTNSLQSVLKDFATNYATENDLFNAIKNKADVDDIPTSLPANGGHATSADSATNDGNGNNIATTYVKKSELSSSFYGVANILNGSIPTTKSVAFSNVTSSLRLSLNGVIPNGRSVKAVFVHDTKSMTYSLDLGAMLSRVKFITGIRGRFQMGKINLATPNETLVLTFTQINNNILMEISSQ